MLSLACRYSCVCICVRIHFFVCSSRVRLYLCSYTFFCVQFTCAFVFVFVYIFLCAVHVCVCICTFCVQFTCAFIFVFVYIWCAVRVCICSDAGFQVSPRRPEGTTRDAGFQVSPGRPEATTRDAGFQVSPGRPEGTTRDAGFQVGTGGGKPAHWEQQQLLFEGCELATPTITSAHCVRVLRIFGC